MKEKHQPEREEISRHRLLDLERVRLQRFLDAGEGGQISVDRERPQCREAGEKRREAPAEMRRATIRRHGRVARAEATFASAPPQSPSVGWRKRRALAYHALSSRPRSQRQSGSHVRRIQTGFPMAPARCATEVSTLTTRS